MKKIIIAGGTGFLGSLLVTHFSRSGHEVTVLSRQVKKRNSIHYVQWDAKSLGHWTSELEGADMLINLAGKSVDCRYTSKNKAMIYRSRLESTQVLGEAIKNCQHPPKLWVNASSATIYRHAEDRPMDEVSGEYGKGFSVDVCQQWEQAFHRHDLPGTRKVALRIGIVLGKDGGALAPLVKMARLGMGGKHGNGSQYVSWLHEADFVRIVQWIMDNGMAQGTYNCTAPEPLQNHNLMARLRQSLHIPIGMPCPAWLLEIGAFFLGTETELLLKSRWVIPKKLIDQGFRFSYPDIIFALRDLLGNGKQV